MEPKCHPEKSRARSETDLQAEQDEFFLYGSATCVKLVNQNSGNCNKSPSIAVLDEIIERPTTNSAIKPPTFKAPLKPVKIIKKEETGGTEEDIRVTLNKISKENDEKLAAMSSEEIEEMKMEIFESVPESFLEKLRQKRAA